MFILCLKADLEIGLLLVETSAVYILQIYQYYAPAHYSQFEYSSLEISKILCKSIKIWEKIMTKSQFLVQNY